ncbi:DUF819 family protein [Lentiprolixibacter aurantiacus]|uniref:DUF819 family protein n=1 Tax=Lentiprolixibacter aurantiacus TaxID=2993939 RepID=A0AAE3SPR7_9FLAO|nr:DUF819 family protein [Lentiprolixibacter aurantiacus]MCX2719717.1 DUF819 family protein [Lentiprolixibacter aurantiacus]
MPFTENPIYVLMVLALLVLLSVYSAKTSLGKNLGAALLVILFAAVLANLKLIPSASNSIPLYDGIFTYVAPISIFYLLLDVNLGTLKKAGIPMIGLFLIGSFATLAGILLSWWWLSPSETLGEAGKIIAGMLAGTYTGGSINFNAIAIAYNFQEESVLYAGTIAVDNVVTTIWILATLAFPVVLRKIKTDKKIIVTQQDEEVSYNNPIDLSSLMWLLFLGVLAYYLSDLLSQLVPQIPSILTISTISLVLAQFKFIKRLNGSHSLGLYMVFLFLAVIGAYCEISAVVALKDVGVTLLLFALGAVLIHGALIILVGGLLFRDWDMLAIASQANIGGGTSAIALAESFDRKELILPAILVGTLGNALGTYLGFLVVWML